MFTLSFESETKYLFYYFVFGAVREELFYGRAGASVTAPGTLTESWRCASAAELPAVGAGTGSGVRPGGVPPPGVHR